MVKFGSLKIGQFFYNENKTLLMCKILESNDTLYNFVNAFSFTLNTGCRCDEDYMVNPVSIIMV